MRLKLPACSELSTRVSRHLAIHLVRLSFTFAFQHRKPAITTLHWSWDSWLLSSSSSCQLVYCIRDLLQVVSLALVQVPISSPAAAEAFVGTTRKWLSRSQRACRGSTFESYGNEDVPDPRGQGTGCREWTDSGVDPKSHIRGGKGDDQLSLDTHVLGLELDRRYYAMCRW